MKSARGAGSPATRKDNQMTFGDWLKGADITAERLALALAEYRVEVSPQHLRRIAAGAKDGRPGRVSVALASAITSHTNGLVGIADWLAEYPELAKAMKRRGLSLRNGRVRVTSTKGDER